VFRCIERHGHDTDARENVKRPTGDGQGGADEVPLSGGVVRELGQEKWRGDQSAAQAHSSALVCGEVRTGQCGEG